MWPPRPNVWRFSFFFFVSKKLKSSLHFLSFSCVYVRGMWKERKQNWRRHGAAVCWSWVGTVGVVPRDGCGGFCGWPWKTLTNALKKEKKNPDSFPLFLKKGTGKYFNILKKENEFLSGAADFCCWGYARRGDWSASSPFAGHGCFFVFFYKNSLKRISKWDVLSRII